MGMPLYLKVADRVVKMPGTYDDLQDTKGDFPWNIYEVWAEKGSLYATFLAPDEPRYYGTRTKKERA